MPWGLKRFQEARCLHFLTFSCYDRAARLGSPHARDIFEQTVERVRRWYGFYVAGYVVMPEHVHLLVSEPKRAKLSLALQMLKQNVGSRVARSRRRIVLAAPGITTLMSGAKLGGSRSCGISIAIRCEEGWFSSPEEWAWSSFSPLCFRS